MMPSTRPPDPQTARGRVWLRRFLRTTLFLIIVIALIIGVFVLWYITRPQPAPIDHQPLFPGIWYTRELRQTPVAQVIHIVEIDLTTPGLHFRVTPADDIDGFIHSARTTSQYLEEQNLALAINADYFDPWRDYHIFDYYPHVGDGVNIRGLAVSEGQVVTNGYVPASAYASLFITADNQASFEAVDQPYNVVSGNTMLVREGQPLILEDTAYVKDRHPRTAVALTEDKSRLLILLIDGRQPNYSEGATLKEVAEIMMAYGGYDVLNLDGGGSTDLVMRGEDGRPVILNSPIHNRIPGRERPIANHLGVWLETP